MIAIDWGTTNLRAFRLSAGVIVDRATGAGVSATTDFPASLRAVIAPWIDQGERNVLLSGMVGSRQGWREVPYLPCPADVTDLAAAAIRMPFEGADVRLVPGLACTHTGVPEVMRGEEVQIAGVLEQVGTDATICLPGTHSKWASIVDRRVERFTTHLTGETFAALRHHTILGRLMDAEPNYAQPALEEAAFASGVARSAEPGGLLHHLFGVRTLGLFDRLTPAQAPAYLSGLLIGHEIRAAAPAGVVYLVGAPSLTTRYAAALRICGATPFILDEDAAAAGLWQLSEHIAWT